MQTAGQNETRLNYNQRAYWMVQVTNRWYVDQAPALSVGHRI